MTFTLTATAEPSHTPPRTLLTASESDTAKPLQSCEFFRDGVPLRFAATIAGTSAIAYDYDAPFDVSAEYRADATEPGGSGLVTDWTETWASLASWTVVNAGWSVAAGAATASDSAATADPVISRGSSGTILKLSGVNPTATLSAGTPSLVLVSPGNYNTWNSTLVVALVTSDGSVTAYLIFDRIRDYLNVETTTITLTTALGTTSVSHSFTTFDLIISGSSITASGTGWSLTTAYVGAAVTVELGAQAYDTAGVDTPTGTVSIDDVTCYKDNSTPPVPVTASDTETLSGSGVWLMNTTTPDLALQIDDCADVDAPYYMTEDTRKTTQKQSTAQVLSIEGSAYDLVVNTGPRKKAKWPLVIQCKTETARDNLDAVLADNAPISLRVAADHAFLGLDSGFYAVDNVDDDRPQGPTVSEETTVTLPLTPVVPPAFDVLFQWNYAALAQTGMTYAEVATAYPTYLDLLIGPTS